MRVEEALRRRGSTLLRFRLISAVIAGSFLIVWFYGLGEFVLSATEEMIRILDQVSLPQRYELESQTVRRAMDAYVERVFRAKRIIISIH